MSSTRLKKDHNDFCGPCLLNDVLYFTYLKPVALLAAVAVIIGLFFWVL